MTESDLFLSIYVVSDLYIIKIATKNVLNAKLPLKKIKATVMDDIHAVSRLFVPKSSATMTYMTPAEYPIPPTIMNITLTANTTTQL